MKYIINKNGQKKTTETPGDAQPTHLDPDPVYIGTYQLEKSELVSAKCFGDDV